jgi:tetratricopeptide (TPR) repeat protein
MAKISLHAYTREIENLIERGLTEEAIGHCKHILTQFPKHINTYRLLGKSYLESQRYSEATDILQRVLSSIPDDIVSQLGMSIIREDEGNLDAAIWHMERAYEIQPANTAIHDELRRLYGRRDGVEPPKIRMTRGALVRMYARGELYSQAISEARAALAEDAQRIDLEIILAQMYYLADMKVEAAEVCVRLVGKLPYCLEANRILADILPSTSRAEDAALYQQNLHALDPYAAFLSPAATTSEQVPDNAVQVERLNWTPSAEDQQPDWARTIGVDYQPPAPKIPDWLASLPSTAPGDELTSAPEEAVDYSGAIAPVEPSQIPGWMREAGWTQAGDEAREEPSSVFELAGEDDIDLADTELPAWIKELAPQDETAVTPEDPERLVFLDSILPQDTAEAPSEKEAPESMEAEEIPDLNTLNVHEIAQETGERETDTSQWINEIGVVEDSTIYKTGRTGSLPSWLEQELEADTSDSDQLPEEELPEWLRTIGEAEQPAPPIVSPEPAPEQVAEKPDDEVVSSDVATPEPLAEIPVTQPSQAMIEPAEAEEVLSDEQPQVEPIEIPPEWVYEETGEPAATIETRPGGVEAEIEIPLAEIPGWIEDISAEEEQVVAQSEPGQMESQADWFAELSEEAAEPQTTIDEDIVFAKLQTAELYETVEEPQTDVELPEADLPASTGDLEMMAVAEPQLEAEKFAAEHGSTVEATPQPVEDMIVPPLVHDDKLETSHKQAIGYMESGEIDRAVEQYNQIIATGEMLNTVIDDLRKALDRHPVDISLWQALGDAYLRNDQVQEALDSYTKAEELLR